MPPPTTCFLQFFSSLSIQTALRPPTTSPLSPLDHLAPSSLSLLISFCLSPHPQPPPTHPPVPPHFSQLSPLSIILAHLCKTRPLGRKICNLVNMCDSFVFLPNTPGGFQLHRVVDRCIIYPIMALIRREIHTFVLFDFILGYYSESDKTLLLGPTSEKILCFLASGS